MWFSCEPPRRRAPDRRAPGSACSPTQRECGAVAAGADVIPFPTLASVWELYHLDPELSISKCHYSKSGLSEICLERTQ